MKIKSIIYPLFFLVVTACSSEKPNYLEPHLTTLAATDITRNEATLHGTAVVEGKTEMPQLHFCYGTTQQMELSTIPATANGISVDLELNQLKAGTTYYYMLQGSNGRTTITSNQMSFTTLPNEKPSIGETTLLSRGPMSAIVGFEIVENGGEPITEAGCYYCIDGGEKQKAIASSVGQNIKLRIGELERNASYQIWAYAKNSVGESIGSPIIFTTSDAIVLGEAGELSTLMGGNLFVYTTLSLAGPLNGDDLACLRKMMGRNIDDTTTPGKLVDIDMSDVEITSGGGSYGISRYTIDGVIGQGLFAHCTQLQHIILPSTATTIEKDAFQDCTSLQRIEIPASITSLLPSSGCTALEELSVSSANGNYSSQDGVLLNAAGTEIVWFPMGKKGTYTLPSTITQIGDYAFKECSIETFRFPDGLKEIGQGAFMNSKVREIILPRNLRMLTTGIFQGCSQLQVVRLGGQTEKICEYAFDGCPLTDLYVTSTNPPTCEPDAFATKSTTSLYTSCTLHVPAGKKNLYQNHATWGQFSNITEQ